MTPVHPNSGHTDQPVVEGAVDPSDAAVSLRGVSQSFGNRSVLDDVHLTIPTGQFVALLGRSGSGKTALLRILSGLDPASAGEVRVAQRRTMVFQEPRLIPSQRVWRNVLLGLNARSRRTDALACLAEVGLADHADDWPALLSGGEAQRVALARALIREPQLLLLDEPFAALDALTRVSMHRLIRRLCALHGPATLLVTHDVDEAIALADRVLVLADSRIGLDLRLDPALDRSQGSSQQVAIRRTLLHALGADEQTDLPLASTQTELERHRGEPSPP